MKIETITINGVEYEPIDSPSNWLVDNCLDCDILKARPPQTMMQVPLCCEKEYIGVAESCWKQLEKGIHRIWKKKQKV